MPDEPNLEKCNKDETQVLQSESKKRRLINARKGINDTSGPVACMGDGNTCELVNRDEVSGNSKASHKFLQHTSAELGDRHICTGETE